MNEKKAVQLAQESEAFVVIGHNVSVFTLHQLLRFVELVEQDVKIRQMPKFEELARLVRREERERCANVIDELVLEHPGQANKTAMQCAQAIRDLE